MGPTGLPGNIQATVVYDQAGFVGTSVLNVRDAILVGGLFSILILLAFLRSWRATLISALAIPITLAITFLFLHWTGETLNLMSLGGLAVAIGLIIDDTVVVIENIARHLAPARMPGPAATLRRPGRRRLQRNHRRRHRLDADDGAGLRAAGVHRGGVRPVLRLTELVAVDRGAGVDGHQPDAGAGVRGQVPGGTAHARAWSHLSFFCEHLRVDAGRCPAFPLAVLVVSLLAVGMGIILIAGIPAFYVDFSNGYPMLTLAEHEKGKPPPPPFFQGLKTGLMPAMDEGAFVLDYWAPSGTPLEATEKKARQSNGLLSENPDIDAYVRRTGAELGLFATQTYRGDIQVVLRPAEDDRSACSPSRSAPNSATSRTS